MLAGNLDGSEGFCDWDKSLTKVAAPITGVDHDVADYGFVLSISDAAWLELPMAGDGEVKTRLS